jgi:hypothetical protein
VNDGYEIGSCSSLGHAVRLLCESAALRELAAEVSHDSNAYRKQRLYHQPVERLLKEYLQVPTVFTLPTVFSYQPYSPTNRILLMFYRGIVVFFSIRLCTPTQDASQHAALLQDLRVHRV